MTRKITGGCLCRACRYATEASPINVRVCHCRKCQQAIGASFNARVLVPLDTLQMSGPINWYESSEQVRRGFCRSCGTTMFSERKEANAIGVTLGSLDDPDTFKPSDQIWTSTRQAWLSFDTPTSYPEAPPA